MKIFESGMRDENDKPEFSGHHTTLTENRNLFYCRRGKSQEQEKQRRKDEEGKG